ncbi:tryptophan synthase beta subunit-like PLP-dependent enzyme [Cyberlindnera jadinii NRRL Y-1542]|uniref:Tryptophan synthase beta subunit-like PLP-dependent enzyme n=2 Tax=Cyberlindnera jadinii (strain ATCC 18201 / CBS 1600 / BCRC 20928 / JCM 3617 / NBRC 0987 / NRRL Y-1542) TaxID=983966 RepID=A0A1E4RUK2_CYBJN|nr:tryptophan synthase beta subunit-like PLP-dependent enzyme [Cyberlindnera jadinii NRRL Y-1542]ODV70957.1 tryptophan synthase beta subunit-like PLP-dependent enzyme [Cyberlindnera jadinii NRRL Y-1542]
MPIPQFPNYNREQFLSRIGNTPLIKHESLSRETGRNIFFKAEYTNPGQSIKDRAVMKLLDDVVASGAVSPGGTLVESTGGNSGVSLGLLARLYTPCFKVVLFVPDSLIQDKVELMESLGCTVVKCPAAAPPGHRDCFVEAARIYAEETPNCVFVDQMNNLKNRQAHYETTGPEIWSQLEGRVDGFVASAGTGGTFMGIASYLKDMTKGKAQCWFADKVGSGLCQFITSKGQSWECEAEPSFVDGIGKHNLTGQMSDALKIADGAVTITDTEAILMIYNLINEQDCWIGASGGLNLCAAKQLALTLPEGSNVVTTVADGADKYESKLFSRNWLVENGHWDSIPVELRKFATYDL